MKALAVARIHGTLTRWEYKEENCKLVKYRVGMTMRGISTWQAKVSLPLTSTPPY